MIFYKSEIKLETICRELKIAAHTWTFPIYIPISYPIYEYRNRTDTNRPTYACSNVNVRMLLPSIRPLCTHCLLPLFPAPLHYIATLNDFSPTLSVTLLFCSAFYYCNNISFSGWSTFMVWMLFHRGHVVRVFCFFISFSKWLAKTIFNDYAGQTRVD